MKSLEDLIQYQLSEGLKEHQLAEDIGMPTFTIHGVLKGRSEESRGLDEIGSLLSHGCESLAFR